MRFKKLTVAVMTTLMMVTATSHASALATPHLIAQVNIQETRRARASLRLDIGPTKAWVGQALPITVTAFFRDVEGVTLEGPLQLNSKSVVTSSFAKEPHQSTEIVGGERTLVVRWTGTVTPSMAGPLDIAVDLPVRLRYREAAPQVIARNAHQDDDPFADLGTDPFAGFGADPFQMLNQMRKQMQRMQPMFEQPFGRAQEVAVALKASAHPIKVLALPVLGQPATFSGAVGRFDIKASVSSASVHIAEPVTLRVTVEGDGDLDRVDLPGVAASDSWKAYPPKAIEEPSAGRRSGRKVFEQILVPLQGGSVTVPPVSLTAFDPTSGRYVTRETSPLVVSVAGTLPLLEGPITAVHDEARPVPRADLPKADPWRVGLRVAPVFLFVFAALAYRALARRRSQRSLRKAMKLAASQGSASRFYDSAHRLITGSLAERWGVLPEEITTKTIQEHLGAKGDALVNVLATNEAFRFGRASVDGANLKSLSSSIEQSLRGAT